MGSSELSTAELFKEDLYAALEIDDTASDKEIKKAYRKQALKCHPDKNPDNPQATKLFNKLSCIFEILANKETRAEYDKIVVARKAAAERNYQLDAKRRKLKEDLERREQEALSKKNEPANSAAVTKNLEQMLRDLRSNGSKLLREEQELLKKELNQQKSTSLEQRCFADCQPKFKLKWDKNLEPQYDEHLLRKLFSKYGEISVVVVSSKKGSAIIEFEQLSSAQLAFENEHGVLTNRLKLEWIGQPPPRMSEFNSAPLKPERRSDESSGNIKRNSDTEETKVSQINFEEEEEQMFVALRRAAERQKLMAEMKSSDADDLT